MDDYDSIRRLEEWKQQRSQRLESRSASIIEGAEAQAILDGPPPLLPTTDGEPLKFDSCTPDSDLTDFREAVATLDRIATRVKVAELRRAVTDDELRAAAALLNAVVMEFRGEALRSGVDADRTPTSTPNKSRIEAATARDKPFVCLPHAVLKHPPIAHRGRPADGLLEVLSVAIAAAVIALVRAELAAAQHAAGLDEGKAEIGKERQRNSQEFGEDLREITIQDAQPAHRQKDRLGFLGGRQGRPTARGREGFEAPAELTIEASPWRLLRAARMSDNARNLALCVGAAIERLRAPVKAGSKELPPLIATVRRLDNGKGRRFVINPNGCRA